MASVSARIGWKALTADEYVSEGFAFLSTPNIKRQAIDFENVNYITQFRYEESPELQLREGDVLLAKDGNTLGITNVVQTLPRLATVNGSIAVIRPRGDFDPRFLRYFLESQVTQALIQNLKGGMGVPHLFQEDLRRFPVAAPPRDVQVKVVNFLDREITRLDDLTALKRALLRLNHERLGTLARKLTSSDAQSRPWPSLRVAHAFTTASGATPKSDDVDYYDNSDILWVTSSELRDGPTSAVRSVSRRALRDYPALRIHKAGSVLIAMYGANVGRLGILQEDSTSNQAVCALTPRGDITPGFAFYWLLAHRQRVLSLAAGSTQPNISQEIIRSVQMAVPPLTVQASIVDQLTAASESLYRLDQLVSNQVELLVEHRQALITAAVTGQLDVAA